MYTLTITPGCLYSFLLLYLHLHAHLQVHLHVSHNYLAAKGFEVLVVVDSPEQHLLHLSNLQVRLAWRTGGQKSGKHDKRAVAYGAAASHKTNYLKPICCTGKRGYLERYEVTVCVSPIRRHTV